jgi:hypothetical protein
MGNFLAMDDPTLKALKAITGSVVIKVKNILPRASVMHCQCRRCHSEIVYQSYKAQGIKAGWPQAERLLNTLSEGLREEETLQLPPVFQVHFEVCFDGNVDCWQRC